MFFSFDGIDGVGKSTQIDLFCEWLRQHRREVVQCRDPGSTALGEAVRDLLLKRHDLSLSRMAEMLLYMAARAQLVEQVIKPALRAGKIVVSDRYLLANIVYQGYAGGLDVPQLWDLGNFVTGGVQPQLTFLLDMPPKAASDRIRRPLDRMEQQGEDFRERLRTGFLEEAKQHPETIAVVDATRSIEDVHADIQRTAMALLE